MKWLALLQHVPWSDVIANAPKVVDSAKKLWESTVSKPAEPPAPAPPPEVAAPQEPAPPSPEALAIAALQPRVDALEQSTHALREQLHAGSELLKTLAEQNTQLIHQLQAQARQLRQLAWALAGVGCVALAALGLGWLNRL